MVIDYIMSFAQWFFAVFLGPFDLPRIFDSSFFSSHFLDGECLKHHRDTQFAAVFTIQGNTKKVTLDSLLILPVYAILTKPPHNKILRARGRDLSMTSKIKI